MRITLKSIEESIAPLGGQTSYGKEFIFDLLAAYGRSTGNITRLKNGSLNVAPDTSKDIAQKNIVFFRPVTNNDSLYGVIDTLKTDQTVIRYSIRFVIVTDYKQLLAIDTKTNETLDIPITQINKYFTFFLPWAGMEKAQYVAENHADIKAAYKMSKLFDEIVSYNHRAGNAEYYHGLNVFFSRLLFCFFAEDTEIFNKGQFTKSIESHTQSDGSDLAEYLDELFFALDAEDKEGYPAHVAAFPYVNGGLFHTNHKSPGFNSKARQLLLECGSLDWSDINPDIFGSMIQAVVNPGQRAGLGMHYTSVPNIMKTIEPLFLNDLKDEFNKRYDDANRLERLLGRIGNIKVFDPACGSGNFLVIAYKELRKLEHAILERQGELGKTNAALMSRVSIENFYGIEIDDFAHEVAVLSLWLAKHQMNLDFKQKFGTELPLIPLREAGNIVHGNAARLDWKNVCPNKSHPSNRPILQQSKLIEDEYEQAQLLELDSKEWDEIYLISNPPYLGTRNQKPMHKADKDRSIKNIKNYKNLDYIAIWFYKGAKYIEGNSKSKLAFVTTNSITQGDQVAILWPTILANLEIDFAYTSFKWANNAKRNAGVTVAVIALRNPSSAPKRLYEESVSLVVDNINAYLAAAPNIFVGRRSEPIADLPTMSYGNYTGGCETLILSPPEKNELIELHPESSIFIKKLIGSEELNKGIERYCLWIDTSDLALALSIPEIKKRIEAVKTTRLKSPDPAMKKLASRPYQFRDFKTAQKQSIIVPIVFSERRLYIPCGFLDASVIIPNSAQAIYDPEPWIFGMISSSMHMAWVRVVAGQLETRIRYSSAIAYNNMPVPHLSDSDKHNIEIQVYDLLDAREHHSEMTLAELYNPESMPEDLRASHDKLDKIFDSIYRTKPFENDEDRLSHLFELYEKMRENKMNEGKLL